MQNWEEKKKRGEEKKKLTLFYNILGRSEKGKQKSFFLGLIFGHHKLLWFVTSGIFEHKMSNELNFYM